MGHQKSHWRFRYNHGGELRKKRAGRGARPLSTRTALHLVFKADRRAFKRGLRSPLGFAITMRILKKYSRRFHVKIAQAAVCNDHIHLIIRLPRRALGQYFFRVVAGQIAQQFGYAGLLVTDTPKKKRVRMWLARPFTRVVLGARALRVLRDYVRLNHLESTKQMAYRPMRLRGMLPHEYARLWGTA